MNEKPKRNRRVGKRDWGTIESHQTSDGVAFAAVWQEAGRRKKRRGFRTRGDAAAFLSKTRTEIASGVRRTGIVRDEVTLGQAIQAYEQHRREKGNKERALRSTTSRLEAFFVDRDARVAKLTSERCVVLYDAARSRVSEKTGKPYAADTHRNMLVEARSLLKFCVARRWAARNPLEGLEGKGKRRHGKPQLRIDEARRWMAKAVELADAGEPGAVAAMVALLLGMRASEIVSRVVRDLDDDGNLLWIPETKTEAGRRTLRVPAALRLYLVALAANRASDELIFGEHWRDWPRKWVQEICRQAGVPEVSAHSMRGLHSTLAMEAGITGAVVAASLGHENASTTMQSYAKPEAVATAQQARVLSVLNGGKTGEKAA